MSTGVSKLVADLSQAKRTYIANQIKNLTKGYRTTRDSYLKNENRKAIVENLLDKHEIKLLPFDFMKAWDGERSASNIFGLEDFFSKGDHSKIITALDKAQAEYEKTNKVIYDTFFLEQRQLPLEIMTSATLTIERLEQRIAVLQLVVKQNFRQENF